MILVNSEMAEVESVVAVTRASDAGDVATASSAGIGELCIAVSIEILLGSVPKGWAGVGEAGIAGELLGSGAGGDFDHQKLRAFTTLAGPALLTSNGENWRDTR